MNALPLLKRATEDGVTFVMTPRTGARPAAVDLFGGGARMPGRMPGVGEQYRFHVDMGKCIGCKCCVVACNEQNGNPASINWRRVGEIEGGWYPDTRRSFLSMGCNHCLEPTCLSGCPVDAYSKDPATGIVRHSADTCIGCQYCTWNCSYGVPQYNPERGVVGKCDMCHGRLELGQAPACVTACPEGAIAIEIVNVAEWRSDCGAELAGPRELVPTTPGVPSGDHSLSTTRITMPERLPPNARPVDLTHVAPADPHWPLVVMTVLTQLSVGAFASIWLLHLLGATSQLGVAALMSLLAGALALSASTLHLGRPVHAYRAVKMWRRSWLSREVLLFSAFAGVAAAYAGVLWVAGADAGHYDLGAGPATAVGALTVLLGLAGVMASACIYRVPSRPAWNTPYTLIQFTLTAAVLGPLFAAAAGAGRTRWLLLAAAVAAGAELVLLALRFFRLNASDRIELRGSARLLSTTLASRFVLRGVLLALGAILLPLLAAGSNGDVYLPVWMVSAVALALALSAELLGRYLFFVSVVPSHMTAPYVAFEAEAA